MRIAMNAADIIWTYFLMLGCLWRDVQILDTIPNVTFEHDMTYNSIYETFE